MGYKDEDPEKPVDGHLRFWLHQEHCDHRRKEMVYVGRVPSKGEVLLLYVGPRQLVEIEVLGIEGGNLLARRVHGINHYLHILQLVAVELYTLPLDLRNGLVAELSRVLERALTDEQPVSKNHCDELMRILTLARAEKKLEAPHAPKPRRPVCPTEESAARCPICGRDDFSPDQVPDSDGEEEQGSA